MTQPSLDEAELLELLELTRIGEEKARKLYETATAIVQKYKQQVQEKLATTSQTDRKRH